MAKSCCRRARSVPRRRQERFEIVWRIVTNGALGVIILIDCTSAKAPEELRYYTQYFHKHQLKHIVIGITHNDMPESKLNRELALKILAEEHFNYLKLTHGCGITFYCWWKL